MIIKNKILSFIKKFSWPLSIVGITLLICILNFQSGKWLTGWDTLHPEFNFQLHFYRSIFGVWREDQGLGTLAAHSHMSELPRILILGLLSIIFPLNIVRIVFVFICFILGPLGVYYFIKNIIFKDNEFKSNVSAFLASLVYIFNLGTVQHFYVVFEMFAVQYAAIGWIFLYLHKILDEPNKKNLKIFFLISFLSAPMAYASQLWFALFGSLIVYISILYLYESNKKVFLNNTLKVFIIFISANSFWLFPNLYFLTSGASRVPSESHINRIFSQESFLFNSAFGQIKDVAVLKNFLFDWSIYDFNQQKFVELLSSWKIHLENPLILSIGYIIFTISILGIGKGFLKKDKEIVSLFLVFIISIFVLMNSNFPFDTLFNLLRENISILKEGLRTPFTKFSILTMFTLSIFFGYAINWIFKKHINYALYVFTSLLIIYGYPMFKGELISNSINTKIPTEYFELFDWSTKQTDNSRIALLPASNFVGWEYNNWGYQGAGFIWFGIKQPFLARDFDRWSPYNETFYNEMSTAIYGNDVKHFQRILTKYQISFLLLDESKIEPNSKDKSILRNNEIKEFLTLLGIKETWKKNFLTVYDVRNISKSNSNIIIPNTFSKINADNKYTRRDEVFENNGNYVNFKDESTIYPFENLSQTKIDNIIYQKNNLLIKRDIQENSFNSNLVIPPIANEKNYTTSVNITYIGNRVTIKFQQNPTIYLGETNIKLEQIPDITFETISPFGKIGLIIGSKQIDLNNGSSRQIDTTFEVKKPIIVEYYDFSKVVSRPNGNFIPKQEVFSRVYNEVIWNNLISEKRYKILNNINSLTLNVNAYPQSINIDKSLNCNEKTILNSEKLKIKNDFNFISNDKDYLCEGLELADINQNESYLLRWKYINESGRTIKFFLYNQASNRVDLEELLPENQVEAAYSIISWPNLSNEGYKLTYENRSLGQNSSNIINEISVYRLPSSFIKKIRIEPQDYEELTSNKVKVESTTKFGNFFYISKVLNINNSGLLVLDQGFDKGWVGLKVEGIKINNLEHVIYNGWANGWKLPKGEFYFIIFYWPQLLSFAGFILGILVFIKVLRNKFN